MREMHRNSKELRKHMYQNFISRHFSNQSGIIVLVYWSRAHCGVLQLTETSSLGPDSTRTSPRNETVKQCRRQMTVATSSGRHEHDDKHDETIHDTVLDIRPRTPLVYKYHVISRTQSHSAVFGCSPSR